MHIAHEVFYDILRTSVRRLEVPRAHSGDPAGHATVSNGSSISSGDSSSAATDQQLHQSCLTHVLAHTKQVLDVNFTEEGVLDRQCLDRCFTAVK
jgi:hypothetical protein